jgi:hypothetical protein
MPLIRVYHAQASGDFLVGHDAFASINLEGCSWHVKLYTLSALRIQVPFDEFEPRRQHLLPHRFAEQAVWPRPPSYPSGRGKGRGRGRGARTGRGGPPTTSGRGSAPAPLEPTEDGGEDSAVDALSEVGESEGEEGLDEEGLDELWAELEAGFEVFGAS